VKIAIGADHAGYHLKNRIKKYLDEQKIIYTDFGTFKIESCSYPEFAYKVSSAVANKEYDRGILICGTGIGMSITANKVKGVRAAAVCDLKTAKLSRLHNDANVLCLGARTIDHEIVEHLVDVWLHTSFEGGRHQNRVALITNLTGL